MERRLGEQIFNIDGHVAFVTGATGWLGQSISRVLAEAGAHVILNGRSQAKLETLRDAIQGAGYSAEIAAFDVSEPGASEFFFEKLSREGKRLDVLINNAYAGEAGTIASTSADQFAQANEVVVTAAFRCMRAAYPALRHAAETVGQASIINIASMYGVVSPDQRVYGDSQLNNPPFYGTAKAGLLQLTRYMACAYANDNIRVNAISPGAFPRDEVAINAPEMVRALEDRAPLGRIGVPDEMRGPVLFLASDASSYVTGANLVVDGGWTAW